MAGTMFDQPEGTAVDNVGEITIPLAPEPSLEFQEALAEKTPESDEAVRLEEQYGPLAPEDIEGLKTEEKMEKMLPKGDVLRFDTLPAVEREPYFKNLPYIQEGDIPSLLDLQDKWKGRGPDSMPLELVENILNTLNVGIETAKDTIEEGYDTATGAINVGIDSYKVTTESIEDAERARNLMYDYKAGKISKEEYNDGRAWLRERGEKQQKLREALEDQGIAAEVLNSMGQVAPSMVDVALSGAKGQLGGWATKKIVGGLLLAPFTGGWSVVLQAGLVWAPRAGRLGMSLTGHQDGAGRDCLRTDAV